jgi:F420H(2)-dependent biliverdin reductase
MKVRARWFSGRVQLDTGPVGRQTALMARLIDDRNVWLATVRPNGRPHLVPTWFVFVDGKFWIGTGAASVKVRNLTANPRAVVSLEDGDAPVVAETKAVIHQGEFPTDVVTAFAAKYRWDINESNDADVGTVVVIELEVDHWLMGGPQS